MKPLLRRLQYLLNRRRREEELAAEMEFHLEMTQREGGENFGNALRLREEAREAWGWTWIDRLLQDLHYAARVLRKSPGFTLAAILMLAIGIGANVAAFGFFDLMVLRPLNVKHPETLLRFERRSTEAYAAALPYPEWEFFQRYSRTLSAVLGLSPGKLSMEGEGKQVPAQFVSTNYLSELGAVPVLGRVLEPGLDGAPAAEPVVVLSSAFWQRHFGGDPGVIGRVVRLNDKPATVVGVVSEDFGGLSFDVPAVWAPIRQQPYFAAGSRLLTDFSVDSTGVLLWGRLQPGLTPKIAEDELRTLAAELRKQHPDDIWKDESLPSEPGGYAKSLRNRNRHGTGRDDSDGMLPLFALVGALVLLILVVACANLGSLLMARGVARQREIAIRVSVGAGTGRLIRQLFTESVLLGLAGSAAGLLAGYAILRGLMVLSSAPVWLDPRPDWRVVVFAVGVGFAAAILFGLAPAWQVARQRHRAMLARQILVGAQMAASCILLIVSGLLGRALTHAMSTDPGFAYQKLISIGPGLAQHGYSPAKAHAYLDALQSRLEGLPGVRSVALTLTPPLGHGTISAGVTVDGHELDFQVNYIDPQFLSTMKIPLLRGRNFTRGDTKVVVVSESLARVAWPGQDPIGKEFSGSSVVGVCGSARLVKLEDSNSVEAYFPVSESELPSMFMLAETSGRPEDSVRAIATTARRIDPAIFPEVELVKDGFQRKIQSAESTALAVSALGMIAHLLACFGIVGVVAYAVSQRTKEIGIRMALGAKPGDVLSVVLRQFSRPVVAGMVVGIGVAAALSRILRSILYGVSNLDPATYAITIAVFVVTVVVAALVPARRALRVDPLRALRYD